MARRTGACPVALAATRAGRTSPAATRTGRASTRSPQRSCTAPEPGEPRPGRHGGLARQRVIAITENRLLLPRPVTPGWPRCRAGRSSTPEQVSAETLAPPAASPHPGQAALRHPATPSKRRRRTDGPRTKWFFAFPQFLSVYLSSASPPPCARVRSTQSLDTSQRRTIASWISPIVARPTHTAARRMTSWATHPPSSPHSDGRNPLMSATSEWSVAARRRGTAAAAAIALSI